jgi:hypothetical protein
MHFLIFIVGNAPHFPRSKITAITAYVRTPNTPHVVPTWGCIAAGEMVRSVSPQCNLQKNRKLDKVSLCTVLHVQQPA